MMVMMMMMVMTGAGGAGGAVGHWLRPLVDGYEDAVPRNGELRWIHTHCCWLPLVLPLQLLLWICRRLLLLLLLLLDVQILIQIQIKGLTQGLHLSLASVLGRRPRERGDGEVVLPLGPALAHHLVVLVLVIVVLLTPAKRVVGNGETGVAAGGNGGNPCEKSERN